MIRSLFLKKALCVSFSYRKNIHNINTSDKRRDASKWFCIQIRLRETIMICVNKMYLMNGTRGSHWINTQIYVENQKWIELKYDCVQLMCVSFNSIHLKYFPLKIRCWMNFIQVTCVYRSTDRFEPYVIV